MSVLVLAESKKNNADTCVRYPYPIFTILTTPQRISLFSFSGFTCAASTMGLKWLYGKINGIEKFQNEALNPVKVD